MRIYLVDAQVGSNSHPWECHSQVQGIQGQPALAAAPPIRVRVERLFETGVAVVEAPTLVSQTDIVSPGDTLLIDCGVLAEHESLIISLEPGSLAVLGCCPGLHPFITRIP